MIASPPVASPPSPTLSPPEAPRTPGFTPPLWATAPVPPDVDPAFFARQLALHAPAEAEAIIDWLVTRAIRSWMLDEATFWQRVRYQARLVRARAGLANR